MRLGRIGLAGALAVALAIGAWTAGLFAFVDRLPVPGARPLDSTDAIVVLTGGSGRLTEGLRLLIEGRAEKLFISGVYRGVDVAEILAVTQHGQAPLTDRIVLGHDADDTRGNALETARWMVQQDYRSLRLVTAGYHMPRSLFEFRRAMANAEIIAHPVFPENVHLDEWWRWRGTASLLASEYSKYLLGRVTGRHGGVMLYLRSLLFNVAFLGGTALYTIALLPLLALPRRFYLPAGRWWSRAVDGLLRHLVGATVDVRGRPPTGPCIIASKHQSAWDTIAYLGLIDDPCYVIKRELTWLPFYGWHAIHNRQIAVDRRGGAAALRRLIHSVRDALADGRTVVVFPEGTRVAPDQGGNYQVGIAALYLAADTTVVPVALNSGLVWGRRRFVKRPGRIIVEFLEPIAPGLGRTAFLDTLAARIEPATAALVAEARGQSAAK